METLDESHPPSRSLCLPCFRSSTWERVRGGGGPDPWWRRGFAIFAKLREWSELLAGPRWKNFIRQFNRGHHSRFGRRLGYDPLSYAMNFDDGVRDGEEEEEDGRFQRGFSARYVAAPGERKGPEWDPKGETK